MTDEQIALARRAVACKGWKWMPGMRVWNPVGENWFRVADDAGILCASPYLVTFEGRHANGSRWASLSGCSPDLTDPATLGCLLALVRAAWRCPTAYVRQSMTRRQSDGVIAWEVCDLYLDAEACRALGVPRQGSVGSWGHGSEAEALVSALESAP
jgi:hypothetical protein